MSATRDAKELEAQGLSLPIDARAALAHHRGRGRLRANSGSVWRGGRPERRIFTPVNYGFFLEAKTDRKPWSVPEDSEMFQNCAAANLYGGAWKSGDGVCT